MYISHKIQNFPYMVINKIIFIAFKTKAPKISIFSYSCLFTSIKFRFFSCFLIFYKRKNQLNKRKKVTSV